MHSGLRGLLEHTILAVQRGDLIDVDRLLSELTDRQDIDGITLLSGEPLQQAPQVEKLMIG